MKFLFSSESVSEGHPDKVCDQISDAILDAALSEDPMSRVAAETFVTKQRIVIGGEITSKARLDIESIARDTVRQIGYVDPGLGFSADECDVQTYIQEQSPDIAQGVNKGQGLDEGQGAGDQGMMFGYACRQTETYMPMPIHLSHSLVKRLAELRKTGVLAYLRPDAKAQVTVEYQGRQPVRVNTVVVSTQHSEDVSLEQISKDIIENVIKPVMPEGFYDSDTRVLVNPTGRFVLGGPQADAGLTGRKIIVDTYGGWSNHGGGAFSGKDGTKVDRSGAYMARYVAKNLVAAELASEVEIQLAYAIGVSEPVSIRVDTKGTSRLEEAELIRLVRETFDLTPEGIVRVLNLRSTGFKRVAAYGHFGRNELNLTWEAIDKAEELKKKVAAEALV